MSPTRMTRRTLVSGLLLVVLCAQAALASHAASDDYDDSHDLQANSSSGGDTAPSNDDIYDPALLQQAVEEDEQRAAAAESATEAAAAASNQLSGDYMSSQENITSSEEYGDEQGRSQEAAPTTHRPLPMTTAEYVRKGKAESSFVTARPRPAEETDDVSLSDYMDEQEPKESAGDSSDQLTTKKFAGEGDGDGDNTLVPLAMKFYQQDAALDDEALDNKVDRERRPHPVPQPQQQALPRQHIEQRFRQENSSDDEYYADESPESVEPSKTPAATPSTFAPAIVRVALPVYGGVTTTTSTSAPIESEAPEAVLAASAETPTTAVPRTSTTTAAPPSIAPTTVTALPATLAAPTTTTTTTAAAPTTPSTTAPSTTTPPTTTTTRPAGKQGKQINISRRKLLPHEQLRNYIEDAYIRMPLAVIVDPSSESLDKTKALWRDALRTNLNIKIVLVSLNASGVPAAYNFNNTHQFLAALNSIKERDGGDAFVGVVHAAELVPYDSAVFISTASIAPHTELVQDAAITLLKKRIRLYLIWYGERASSENETQEAVGGILGEVAIRSGGEILHIVGSENSQELEASTLTLIADAFIGSQEVDVPVDTTLSSLHVKIDAPMRTAVLETPNGDINLKKLVKFKSRVFTFGADDKRLDAYVPLTKLRKATVYKLKMIPESLEHEYSVFVRAERKADQFLDDLIKRFDSYFMEGMYPKRFRDSRLQTFTASFGTRTKSTHADLKFPEEIDESAEETPKTEVETFSDKEIHTSTSLNWNRTMANVAYGTQRAATNLLQRSVTKIEMGVQSQLLVAPGMMAQLYYEITNTRREPIFHNIQVVDERRFLLRLVPRSVFLRAGETSTVTVTVLIPNGTPQGTIDHITFTCHGAETTSLSLNLKVITSLDSQDTTAPSISWEFGNRCENVNSNSPSCAERYWTIDITTQDWDTGIMRLQSTPAGLIYRNAFTVGSADPLKATYVATCCEPKVTLLAHDVAGNQRSYNIDVRDIVLTEAAIAAIVLGALLLLLLIVLLIASIVWCCRRRKVTLDLPTYRSHSTRSME